MSYDAYSMQKLTFREGVRTRVGIYLGSADHTGVIAGLLELINNATDEALVCETANRIELEIGRDWASCRDYGRGMPHGKNDFAEEVMIDLLTENHSGGKFNDIAYGGKSRGLNGTGSAATCCSSDIFKITSYRDGAAWYMEFENGIPKYKACQKKPIGNQKNGTYIWYKPSQEVFRSEPINFDYNEICSLMENYSYFNKGVKFIVKNAESGETKEFISNNGLIDFAKTKIKNPIHKTPIIFSTTENDVDIEIILQWTKGKEKFYLFSNGGENENGGTPITGIRASITSFIKKQLGDFDGDMARTGLIYICSVNVKDPIYDGQTKSKITNPELRGLAQRATSKMLSDFLEKHSDEMNTVLSSLQNRKKAEAAADKAREAILNHEHDMATASKKKIIDSNKLRDARVLGQNSMLIINEGLSAGGSMSVGRQGTKKGDYIGILMLRGKAINALSNTIEDVLANEEAKLLLQALGLTYGQPYHSRKLRYGKIAIATDADFDGAHIGLLVMALLQRLCPEFIQEGRLYWLRAPICKVDNGKKSWYYYTEAEIENRKQNGNIIFYKGLGQLSEEDLRNSMFSEDQQKLEQLIPSEDGLEALLALMGEEVQPRKDFIQNIDFGGFNL